VEQRIVIGQLSSAQTIPRLVSQASGREQVVRRRYGLAGCSPSAVSGWWKLIQTGSISEL